MGTHVFGKGSAACQPAIVVESDRAFCHLDAIFPRIADDKLMYLDVHTIKRGSEHTHELVVLRARIGCVQFCLKLFFLRGVAISEVPKVEEWISEGIAALARALQTLQKLRICVRAI